MVARAKRSTRFGTITRHGLVVVTMNALATLPDFNGDGSVVHAVLT